MLLFRRFPKEKDGPDCPFYPFFFFLDISNQVKQIISVDKICKLLRRSYALARNVNSGQCITSFHFLLICYISITIFGNDQKMIV